MDFSRLSDEDLLALKNGDLSKVSDAGLIALREANKPAPGFGSPRDLISGVNRTIGSLGDAVVTGYNLMLPKSQEVQPLSEGMRSAGVDLDRPRSFMGMVGEYAMPGPGGAKTQALETLLAAGGGYLARQAAPDSLLAEIGGAVAAPMAFKSAPALVAEGTRRAIRGGNNAAIAERVAAADALGAPMTVGTASQNSLLQVLERLSGSVPGGVTPFRKAGEEAAAAIKDRLTKITSGTADDVVKAGRTIQRGLFDADTGWTARTKQVNDTLYEKLDEKLTASDWWAQRGMPESYGRTVAGGAEWQQPWPDARWADDVAPVVREPLAGPSPYGRATSPSRRQLLMGRQPETIPTSPEVNLPAGAPPPAAGGSRGFPALNTRQFIGGANKGVRGAPSLSETLFQDKEVQGFFEAFVNDIEVNNGSVPYAAIKRLRTEVGDLLGDPELIGSSRRELLSSFYRSLTDDMKAAATEAGALKEFERANAYHKARIERVEDFYNALYKKTTPEEVWSAVIGDNPRSPSRLAAIRKGLKPEEWDFLRKTVVTRMGKPVASAAREGAIDFSANTFLTNYERMKGTGALDQIFGKGQYRKDLDQVAKYASDLRGSAEVLSNPSGTAGLGLSASVYYGALGMAGMALSGNPAAGGLVGIGAGLMANSAVARLMNNQKFVHWLARSTKIPTTNATEVANHLKRLPALMGNDPQALEDVQAFIDAVTGSAP